MAADTTYQGGVVQIRQDGNLAVPTGKSIDIESGGSLKIAGTAITATAAEINAIAGGGLSDTELAVLNGVVAGTVTAGKAVVTTTGKVIDEIDITLLKVGSVDKTNVAIGAASGYKIARGVHTTVAASDTVVTGLTTVVAVVASPATDLDGDAFMAVSASIGDQAGAPAAGSVYIKSWKSNGDGDATMVAATAFSKLVNWIAIGT